MVMDFGESMNACSVTVNRRCDRAVFECNICFDLAQDPIVTLCGHLFCWRCLYRWLHFHDHDHDHDHECPVCKSRVKEESLVPIYGRGTSQPQGYMMMGDGEGDGDEIPIPRRPAGQRPQTAPVPEITYFRQDELGTSGSGSGGFIIMLGNFTRTALFGAIPSFFNFQLHDFSSSSSSAAVTVHGFHQHPVILMICFLFLTLLVVLVLVLVSSSPFKFYSSTF